MLSDFFFGGKMLLNAFFCLLTAKNSSSRGNVSNEHTFAFETVLNARRAFYKNGTI